MACTYKFWKVCLLIRTPAPDATTNSNIFMENYITDENFITLLKGTERAWYYYLRLYQKHVAAVATNFSWQYDIHQSNPSTYESPCC